MTIPLIAGKKGADAAQGSGKALLGDIYTRRWITPKKGKKPAVEHELKVNAASVGIGLLAAGGAALLAGFGLWAMQRKITPKDGKDLVRIIDEMDPVYKTVTVTEPTVTYTRVPGFPDPIERTYDTTVTKEVIDKAAYCQVRTKDGVPLWKSPAPWQSRYMLNRREKSLEYKAVEEIKTEPIEGGTRHWVRFHTDKKNALGTSAREGLFTS